MEPLVTIVIANYNKARFLGETVMSVLSQSFTNWELIIIDDNSTDDSVAIIENQFDDKRIRLIEQKINRGANFCRNRGIDMAKGNYLMFLDSDDLIVPDCLERRISHLTKGDLVDFCVFTMGVFKVSIGDTNMPYWIPNSKNPLKDFLMHNLPWSILQPLWKVEFLRTLNGFDESFERLQDVELNTRALLCAKVNFKMVVTAPDCYYRIAPERRTFRTFEFLSKWMKATARYCDKYYEIVPAGMKRFLFGTLLKSYQQLIYDLKIKAISHPEFSQLEKILFSAHIYQGASINKKLLLKISKFYNKYIFRVPGVNRFLLMLITT